jgi:hypothetical protein
MFYLAADGYKIKTPLRTLKAIVPADLTVGAAYTRW